MSHYEAEPWLPEGLAGVVMTADPIPFDVVQSLRGSFMRRAADAEVAELVYDSVVDDSEGIRGTSSARQLTFEGPHVSVDLEVVPEHRRVVGQVYPASCREIEVRHGRGSYTIDVDRFGRFVADAVPDGPVSFRCRAEVDTVTDWLVL